MSGCFKLDGGGGENLLEEASSTSVRFDAAKEDLGGSRVRIFSGLKIFLKYVIYCRQDEDSIMIMGLSYK